MLFARGVDDAYRCPRFIIACIILIKTKDLYSDFCNLFLYGIELGDPASLLKQFGIGLTTIKELEWHTTFTGDIKH
ncbi:hypothetical protein GCM10011375_32590 [Hymenobacter qilianensis]|uniref:Uncharacterized protein n=1 Tax=Hymenobacter qilianensis TaxID=1385715 RepID=A0ACB5PV28_9BACT|nr:hypothetical protein GCM10011375_32590 [Hymenobacter qilianensis]